MNVALRHPAGCVTEQGGDRQFREPQVTSNAREGMAERVWRHVLQSRGATRPLEHPHDADEVPVAPICREDVGRALSESPSGDFVKQYKAF